MRRRDRAVLLATAVLAVAVSGAVAVAHAAVSDAAVPDGTSLALAPLVASWPRAYTVTGTKAEPLYTEQITLTRADDVFAVRIRANAQGDAALGVQDSVVRLDERGTVRWVSGCTKTPDECSADTALRGFLTQAVLLGLDRQGRMPTTGVARTLHGVPVVCVPDDLLHPDAPPVAVRLDPCFDRDTGAVLGHWSADSEAFVGPTLSDGLVIRPTADPALLPHT